MFDSFETFAGSRAGVSIKSLRTERVVAALAEDFSQRGWRIVVTNRGRLTVYDPADSSHGDRVSPAKAGRLLRRRFLEKYFHGRPEAEVLVQSAARTRTWAAVAEAVADSMADVVETAADGWVKANLVPAAPGEYLLRESVLGKFTAAHPGPRAVRARELSAALRAANLSDLSTDPRQRIDGIVTRVVPGVKFLIQLHLPVRNDDPFLSHQIA